MQIIDFLNVFFAQHFRVFESTCQCQCTKEFKITSRLVPRNTRSFTEVDDE